MLNEQHGLLMITPGISNPFPKCNYMRKHTTHHHHTWQEKILNKLWVSLRSKSEIYKETAVRVKAAREAKV